MDEAEWLECKDPDPMLRFIRYQATHRNRRLFASACCRRAWHLISETDRAAVHINEQLADRAPSEAEFTRVAHFIPQYQRRTSPPDPDSPESWAAWAAWHATASPGYAEDCARCAAHGISEGLAREAGNLHDQWLIRVSEWATQAGMLRCIFGPIPFRLVFADSRWRTSAVMGLVHTIYNDRGFDLLPILADALEDAGCDNADILTHCRSPGPHVRGCWVVDLLLGKE